MKNRDINHALTARKRLFDAKKEDIRKSYTQNISDIKTIICEQDAKFSIALEHIKGTESDINFLIRMVEEIKEHLAIAYQTQDLQSLKEQQKTQQI